MVGGCLEYRLRHFLCDLIMPSLRTTTYGESIKLTTHTSIRELHSLSSTSAFDRDSFWRLQLQVPTQRQFISGSEVNVDFEQGRRRRVLTRILVAGYRCTVERRRLLYAPSMQMIRMLQRREDDGTQASSFKTKYMLYARYTSTYLERRSFLYVKPTASWRTCRTAQTSTNCGGLFDTHRFMITWCVWNRSHLLHLDLATYALRTRALLSILLLDRSSVVNDLSPTASARMLFYS